MDAMWLPQVQMSHLLSRDGEGTMPALPISPDHEHTHSKGPCGRFPLRSTWSERVTWLPLAAREDGGQAQGLYVRLNPVVICHLGARRIATPNETRARLAERDEGHNKQNGVRPSWCPVSVLRSRPRCPGQAHIASPPKYLRASPEGTSALRSLRSRPSRPATAGVTLSVLIPFRSLAWLPAACRTFSAQH